MELNLNYNQILKLIYRLPDKDKRKILSKLRAEFFQKEDKPPGKIKELILKAPTWSDEQLAEYQERKQHINNSKLV